MRTSGHEASGKGMLMVQASGESAGSVPIKIETKADMAFTPFPLGHSSPISTRSTSAGGGGSLVSMQLVAPARLCHTEHVYRQYNAQNHVSAIAETVY